MKEETKKITCIICPTGCEIRVRTKGDEIVEVSGNACPEGEKYATQEVKSPERVLMSVVKCKNCDIPTVSVKTRDPVRKNKIEEVMTEISEIEIEAPVKIGDVIRQDIGKTGTDLVATRNASKIRN